MHSNIKLCIETSNVDQITIFLDGILAMENYKNTHYLFCLYVKFPCHCQEWILKPFEVEIDRVRSGFEDRMKIRLELKWSQRMATIRFGCEFGVALGTYRRAEDIECCSLEVTDYNLWVDLVEP